MATASDGYVEHFRTRLLQDAIAAALPSTWRRRAEDFDRVGNQRCTDVATACRRHADLLERSGLAPDLLAELAAVSEQTWKEAG